MPGPEQEPSSQPTQEPTRYARAARFAGEKPAGRAYRQAQDAIYHAACDLSTYRFLYYQTWHVAVLGLSPPPDLEQELERTLATGERVTLSPELLKLLQEHRAEAIKRGAWVERYYRRGRRR